MTVPWTGFPMKALVDLTKPLAAARYVEMQTFFDPEPAPGQRQAWYPWPYTEGLTIEEATNELAFLATGIYTASRCRSRMALRCGLRCHGSTALSPSNRSCVSSSRPRALVRSGIASSLLNMASGQTSIRTCRTGAGANRQSACLEHKPESRRDSSTVMGRSCSTSTTASPESDSSREDINSAVRRSVLPPTDIWKTGNNMLASSSVKISQLGRKILPSDLINTYQIGGGSQNLRRQSRGDRRDPARGVGSISGMERHESFEHAFKID